MVGVVIQQHVRLLRDGLAQLLASHADIDVLGSAVRDDDLVDLCAEHEPEVVVLEVDAPDWDPCRLALRLQRSLPGLRFVGSHTESCDSPTLDRARRAGLSLLVPHSGGFAGVVAAVHEARSLPTPRLRTADFSIGKTIRLTDREVAILQLIGAGYTCREVSARLGISSKTVENHKQRTFRKLGVQSQSHAIAIAYGKGLMDSPSDILLRSPDVGRQRDPGSTDVVIAEANALHRDILASVCRSRGIRVAACVRTGEGLLEACQLLQPRVVVTADQFGSRRLDDLVPQILELGVLIIVTGRDPSPERLTSLLGLGVHGYMSGEATPDEVVTGILAVARGAASMDHSTAAMVLRQWQGYRTRVDSRLDLGLGVLTQREADVLRAMTRGLSTKAIARELGVAVKTVENHKIRVFEKLGVRTQAQAVTVAIGYGMAEEGPEVPREAVAG